MTVISQLVLDENNIAFHPAIGNSYQLNGLGKDIILLLREGKSKDEIVQILQAKYDASASEIFIDVSDFFAKLKVYGLL